MEALPNFRGKRYPYEDSTNIKWRSATNQIGGALKVNAKVRGALAHKEGTHAQIGGAT